MTLGQKIKKLRTDKGLTQKDLADQLHVTFQTISKWESDTNEPDIATLKELSKLFDCSVDSLLMDNEIEEPNKVEEQPVAPIETKTIIIHQKELHVCEHCKMDIPDNDVAMEQVCVHHARRGHPAEYRQAYYHKECLAKIHEQRRQEEKARREAKASSSAKKCFGWGIFAGVVALTISLLVMLCYPEAKEAIHPALAVVYSILIGYALFSMVYCIISGSYLGEVFVWCASLSIKFPGIIFSWDLDGLIFLVVMKVLFAIIGFIVGILVFIFAVALCGTLGAFSFPFVLIHDIRTQYEDAF